MQLKDKRNWLVIAHCMNMDGQAASHHVSDKLPYLASKGIKPILLSAASGKKDKAFEHHQVFSLFPSGLKFEMRHFLRNRLTDKRISECLLVIFSVLIFPMYVLEKVFIRFDSQWSWCFSAYTRGISIMRKKSIDAIYVHGGASSAFIAAYWLSKKFKIPWIAECYDPLIHDSWTRSRSAYRWNAMVEGIICEHARLAIWYTEGALNQARNRNSALGDRGVVVRPGMSEPLQSGVNYIRGPKIRFCYFGGLTNERSLVTFLKPLVEILKVKPELNNKIEVHTYGGNLDEKTSGFLNKHEQVKLLLKTHGRLEYDQTTGKSGRQRVNEEMKKADFLILLHGVGQICELYIPSKAYEYLWAKRPIFILTPCPKEWNKFIDVSLHFIVNQNGPKAVSDYILDAIQSWELEKNINFLNQKTYSSEDAIKQIIKLFALTVRN
jgi:hypothetical protein